jgi:hypothetical protein
VGSKELVNRDFSRENRLSKDGGQRHQGAFGRAVNGQRGGPGQREVVMGLEDTQAVLGTLEITLKGTGCLVVSRVLLLSLNRGESDHLGLWSNLQLLSGAWGEPASNLRDSSGGKDEGGHDCGRGPVKEAEEESGLNGYSRGIGQ